MLRQLHKKWWKILALILLLYTFTGGLLIKVPALYVLHETIRNLFFHVPCWFAMILLLLVSLVYSVKYLRTHEMLYDIVAVSLARVALLFGTLGFVTGMLWGNYTWGNLLSWLFNDTKILGAFIGVLIYVSYFILRGSVTDEEKKAKVSAVYSIFAFILLNVFILVIPRLTSSLHPGMGGNPGFNAYDLNNTMRLVFYPAVLAYFLLGLWIASLHIRIKIIHYKIHNIPVHTKNK